MGNARCLLTVLGLLVWPVVLCALGALTGFSLWLIVAMYLFAVQWELVLSFLVSLSLALAVTRVTAALLRSVRRNLVREHAQLTAGACAIVSIGLTALSRFAEVDRMVWGTAGLIWAAWAIIVFIAVRRPR